MKSALLTFQAELSDLRNYLSAAVAEEVIFGQLLAQEIKDDAEIQQRLTSVMQASLTKRRYIYVVAIISLYGAFERYIEDVIELYVRMLSDTAESYARLPGVVCKSHTELSLEYLWLMKEGRIRSTETIEEVVGRLTSCMENRAKYAINARAFTIRTGNLNLDKVRAIFQKLGIELSARRLSKTRSFQSRYSLIEERPIEELGDGELRSMFAGIDALASTRHLLAHGMRNIDDIEDHDLLETRILDLEAYISAIQEVLEQEVLGYAVAQSKLVPLGPAIAVYNHCIVCFDLPSGEVSVGQLVAMRNDDALEPIRYGLIESIEVNNVGQTHVTGAADLKVGMKLGLRARENGEYFLAPNALYERLRE